jgi:hypothetical protein
VKTRFQILLFKWVNLCRYAEVVEKEEMMGDGGSFAEVGPLYKSNPVDP